MGQHCLPILAGGVANCRTPGALGPALVRRGDPRRIVGLNWRSVMATKRVKGSNGNGGTPLINSNQAVEHVSHAIMSQVHSIAERKDEVACGPVAIYLKAGKDTVLSWPSLQDEKERNRKGGEVDWFRTEIDNTQWAKSINAEIDALKDKPKNVVVDREMQTLRQRLSYAASVLRRTRGLASMIVMCEGAGFTVTLPHGDSLTRTVYPITVIDDKKDGLPVQLSVRDFLNLKPLKGKMATDLDISGSRRDQEAAQERKLKAIAPERVVEAAQDNVQYMTSLFSCLSGFIESGELPKNAKVKKPARELAGQLLGYLGKDPGLAA